MVGISDREAAIRQLQTEREALLERNHAAPRFDTLPPGADPNDPYAEEVRELESMKATFRRLTNERQRQLDGGSAQTGRRDAERPSRRSASEPAGPLPRVAPQSRGYDSAAANRALRNTRPEKRGGPLLVSARCNGACPPPPPPV